VTCWHLTHLALVGVLAVGSLGIAPLDALDDGNDGDETLPVDAPVLGAETPRGTWETHASDAVPPATRTVDGDPSDWIGEVTMFGGTAVHSAGELVYTDHLSDAYGADDGRDAERREMLGTAEDIAAESYRIEAAWNANLPGQAGVPPPPVVGTEAHYGHLDYQAHADLVEVRVAADTDHLWLLARTAHMDRPEETALLLLIDAADGPGGEVPFGAGIHTERGDVAVLLAGDTGWAADIATGEVAQLPAGSVATDADGFTNAIEAALPIDLLGIGDDIAVAVATGSYDGAGGFVETGLGANLKNVAFRFEEPSREWFDQEQALALHDGTIDAFLLDVDLTDLRGGRTDRFVPGPGYHERIFVSTTPGLAEERPMEGLFQHYGVYLPTALDDGEPLPLQWWLHWRGGHAHSAAALTPGVFRHMGEDRGGIVVSPRGRGTSTWYVGRGHADLLEVWDDVFATFDVDADRVYLSGHSMGGWGSYLLALLYPDRFAATMPVAGPVTQGAWTGADLDGCDEFGGDEYSPCYISANDGRPRDQHTRKLLENLRNVPIAMFYAGADELVPVAGATRQHERLLELGYRHRFYLFPTYEHFTHPLVDEWAEGVRYLDTFVRDEDPPQVTYVRDLAFERATNEVNAGDLVFDWTFDAAYWMSGLEVAGGRERAAFDATSHPIAGPEPLIAPEAGGPASEGQAGPYTYTGLAWEEDPEAPGSAPHNAFTAELDGASGVTLDLERMRIDVRTTIDASVTTDETLVITLLGPWRGETTVTIDGESVSAEREGEALTFTLEPGTSEIHVAPLGESRRPTERER
jgi:dienelactone hydrolase